MTPVYQKYISGSPNPDCMAACVASILDLKREEVPNFFVAGERSGQFHERVNAFLMRKVGKALVYVPASVYPKDTYYIVFIGFNGAALNHAMVAYNDTIVHAPDYPYFHQEGPIKIRDYLLDNTTAFVSNNVIFIDPKTIGCGF